MASQNDFISKLENFSTSLEDLVEVLKQQQGKSKQDTADTVINNLDKNTFVSIVESLEEIKKDTKSLKTGQEKILSVVESLKSEKDTGILGTVSSKNGKETIMNGVSTIMLMAGGILAMGLTFKLIGNVDFFSVMALTTSMYLVGKTFAEIAEIKNLTLKNVLITAAIIPVMAGSLLVAGLILTQMPVINFMQLATIAVIGLSMSVTTYIILKSLEGVDLAKDMSKILLLPLIMPLIAVSMVVSGLILTQMPIVSVNSLLSVLGVSVALLPMMLSIGYISKALNGVSLANILLLPIIIPLAATAIVAASFIFSMINDIDPIKTILVSGAIGLSLLAFAPTIYLLSKAGLLNPNAIDDLLIATVAIPLISMAIVASSYILGMGTYSDNIPSAEWSLLSGLSLLAFALPMSLIGIIAASGVGLLALGAGLLAIPLIAGAITITSVILASGNYQSYPDLSWSGGVALSLLAFTVPAMLIGTAIMATFGLAAGAIALGLGTIPLIASTIVETSKILSTGTYQNYPSMDWAGGIAMSLGAFVNAYAKLGIMNTVSSIFGGGTKPSDFIEFIKNIAHALVAAAEVFNTSKTSFDITKVPSKEWAEGVALGVTGFADAISKIGNIGKTFGIFGKGMKIEEFQSAIISISKALIAAGNVFDSPENKTKFDINKVPKKEWAESVGSVVSAFSGVLVSLSKGGISFDDEDEVNSIKNVFTSVADGIVAVSLVLDKGKYQKYPDKTWSDGVTGTLSSYAKIYTELEDIDEHDNMLIISKSIISTASYVNLLSKYKTPSASWTNEFNSFLNTGLIGFKNVLSKIQGDNIDIGSKNMFLLLNTIKKMGTVVSSIDPSAFSNGGIISNVSKSINDLVNVLPSKDKADSLLLIATGLSKIADSMNKMPLDTLAKFTVTLEGTMNKINMINVSKVDALMGFGASLNALGLVDNVKLKETLNTITAEREKLTSIIDSNGLYSNISNNNQQSTGSSDKSKENEKSNSQKFNNLPEEIYRDKHLALLTTISEDIKAIKDKGNTEKVELKPENVN